MVSPNWEIIWEERIVTKIKVKDLVNQGNLRDYLNKILEEGHYITPEGAKISHFVNTKNTLMKNIHKAQGYQDTEKAIEEELKTVEKIKSTLTKPISKEVIKQRIEDYEKQLDIDEENAFNSRDLNKHKKLSEEAINDKYKERIENYAYNTAMTIMRERRNVKDIIGLEKLKEEVIGLRDGSELVNSINNTINRVK